MKLELDACRSPSNLSDNSNKKLGLGLFETIAPGHVAVFCFGRFVGLSRWWPESESLKPKFKHCGLGRGDWFYILLCSRVLCFAGFLVSGRETRANFKTKAQCRGSAKTVNPRTCSLAIQTAAPMFLPQQAQAGVAPVSFSSGHGSNAHKSFRRGLSLRRCAGSARIRPCAPSVQPEHSQPAVDDATTDPVSQGLGPKT